MGHQRIVELRTNHGSFMKFLAVENNSSDSVIFSAVQSKGVWVIAQQQHHVDEGMISKMLKNLFRICAAARSKYRHPEFSC